MVHRYPTLKSTVTTCLFPAPLQVVDYALGIYPQYAQLFMLLPKQAASWTTYVAVFSVNFWLLLTVAVIGSAVLFHWVFKMSNFQVVCRLTRVQATCHPQSEILFFIRVMLLESGAKVA